jgi:DNA-binding response OmpR family regulator
MIREETILVIEADGQMRRQLGNALRAHGYSVMLTCGGEEAVNLCRHHIGRIDLALLGSDASDAHVVRSQMKPGFRVLSLTDCPKESSQIALKVGEVLGQAMIAG